MVRQGPALNKRAVFRSSLHEVPLRTDGESEGTDGRTEGRMKGKTKRERWTDGRLTGSSDSCYKWHLICNPNCISRKKYFVPFDFCYTLSFQQHMVGYHVYHGRFVSCLSKNTFLVSYSVIKILYKGIK